MDDDSGFNTFSNDGSFMENFMKMQEEKKKKEEESKQQAPPPKPLFPSLVKKKPLVMKMRGFKKAPTLLKSVKTVSALEGNLPDKEKGDTPMDKEKDKKETQEIKEKESPPAASKVEIPLASSIASRGMAGDMDQVSGTPPSQLAGKKRKRSRWSDAPPTSPPPTKSESATPSGGSAAGPTSDDALISAAMASFGESPSSVGLLTGQPGVGQGGQQLSQEQLLQVKEQIAMNKLVAEIRAATARSIQQRKSDPSQPVVYEYDSDEDTEGGTWEHKLRAQEMLKTLEKARDLTEKGKGKHHIGDFLPPEELEKFIEKARAIKEGRDPDLTDYREHKLDETNIGFRLLQKAGWSEGEGLGEKQDGITAPINQGKRSFDQAGVGASAPGDVEKEDDPFDTYRKRMMLAYRFRPNPLNNPRRPYY